MINLELGTVFRWNNFPDARYGEKNKARWFVCVGFTDLFAQLAQVYACTTTTQLDQFKYNGIRKGHAHHIFKKKTITFFEDDCAIDFAEAPYPFPRDRIDSFENDIEIKGEIDNATLIIIYNSLLDSKSLSPMEMFDIHTSYNMAGITGLKNPKLSHK